MSLTPVVLVAWMALHTSEPSTAPPPTEPPAQEENAGSGSDVADLSLEALLDAEVSVATKKAKGLRDVPGVVTIVTREEILAWGARDLVDVLHRVPGFTFGVDVEGVAGVGVRGNWGYEGKVLFLLDGQELNERLYSTFPLGNELPIDQIERIEIIRGPGSSIYGGFAELAVVNIITRGAALNGAYVSARAGFHADAFARRGIGFQVGRELEHVPGLSFSAAGALGQAIRSGRPYYDFSGQSYSMGDASGLSLGYLNLATAYRGARLRFVHHDHEVETRDGYGDVLPRADVVAFRSTFAELRYDWALGDAVLAPRFQWKRQQPWRVTDSASDLFYDKTVDHYLLGATFSYDVTDALNALVGLEGYVDDARLNQLLETGSQSFFFGSEASLQHRNLAAFTQVLWDTPWLNLTGGVRYELHSEFGPSFVPRAGVTKTFGRFHFKLLFADAFRTPGIENASLGLDVLPERTRVFEGEAGYQLTDAMYLALNGFDITVRRPIVYGYDAATDTEGYANFPRTGSRGLELEYRVQHARGWLKASYSFATTAGKNQVDSYRVPSRGALLLGFPLHKVAASGSVRVLRGLWVTPSLLWLSSRYGWRGVDAAGNPLVVGSGDTVLLDLFVRQTDLFGAQGLELAGGLHNLLGARYDFLQPYDGGHRPLPGLDRELTLRLSYQHDLVR